LAGKGGKSGKASVLLKDVLIWKGSKKKFNDFFFNVEGGRNSSKIELGRHEELIVLKSKVDLPLLEKNDKVGRQVCS
jgi:hypothetical protein